MARIKQTTATTEPTKSILEMSEVSTFYGPIQALNKVSINVDKGEIVTIIGANGAGKSTLLMTVFANPKARRGKVIYKGHNITGYRTNKIAKLGISMVPEGRRIFPAMTVEENLHMGCIHIDKNEIPDIMSGIYDIFPLLKERRLQRGGTLSGGEQQMLAIGRALMSKPQFILLDEPSLGLAPIIVNQIFERLKDIAAGGITILLVEQNANLALQLADRAYVLVNGNISMQGSGKELLNNKEIKDAYLGS